MSIKDRFKMIMEREKLTAGAFAESIGADGYAEDAVEAVRVAQKYLA